MQCIYIYIDIIYLLNVGMYQTYKYYEWYNFFFFIIVSAHFFGFTFTQMFIANVSFRMFWTRQPGSVTRQTKLFFGL